MTLIKRDSFARTELHSERVLTNKTCMFCGTVKVNRRGHGYLYLYHNESDGGTVSKIPGHFCSAGCMRAYHG
jgi:hypothetical protein